MKTPCAMKRRLGNVTLSVKFLFEGGYYVTYMQHNTVHLLSVYDGEYIFLKTSPLYDIWE